MESGMCQVTPLPLMLQGKAQICQALYIHDNVRFAMLKKELAGITNPMLTSFLREPERDGLTGRSRPDTS